MFYLISVNNNEPITSKVGMKSKSSRRATQKVQANNRNNIYYNGKCLSHSDLGEMSYSGVIYRIKKGMSIEEAINKKSSIKKHNGKRYKEYAKDCGIKKDSINTRLKRGWSLEEALSKGNQKQKLIYFEGKAMTLKGWSEYLGIKYSTLNNRLKRNTPINKALQPVLFQGKKTNDKK